MIWNSFVICYQLSFLEEVVIHTLQTNNLHYTLKLFFAFLFIFCKLIFTLWKFCINFFFVFFLWGSILSCYLCYGTSTHKVLFQEHFYSPQCCTTLWNFLFPSEVAPSFVAFLWLQLSKVEFNVCIFSLFFFVCIWLLVF